ncbi:hypothetical protein IB234_05945 [Pseudomonas sp. PDM16]|uniref:hypothetical protein n=1 Tax=Pseudomonas sp. PDM16 TaxID=2769292 RepID=UPI001785FC4D|nr:hypothetical protein [Pseudomonas sp. PDM16]MBD9414098.1 hypothetical protein [Pseudomonas sp. PDM16]
MTELSLVEQFVLRLLTDQSPELGARLKQKLNKLLISEGHNRFDETAFGYKKFGEYLTRALAEKVTVEHPASSGDILVRLKAQSQYSQAPVKSQHRAIRSDVWQAFTSTNPERKHFYDPASQEVVSYLESDQGEPAGRITNSLLEITPIGGDQQQNWMHAFLEQLRLNDDTKTPLEAIAAQTYTSGVNAAFTRALGEHSNSWRHYRTNHIIARVRSWADSHSVSMDNLCAPQSVSASPPPLQTARAPEALNRHKAIKLLELMDDEDIARIVIPTLLSSLLLKSRL